MKLRALSALLTRQALIVGEVLDSLTNGSPLDVPNVTLVYQTPPEEPIRPYPLDRHLSPNGLFVFSGDPRTAFPRLAEGQTLDLRLQAEADGYQPTHIDFSLDADDLTLSEEVVEIDGIEATLLLLSAPLVRQQITLTPRPVHLTGRVVEADDLSAPILGAAVRIIAPEARGPVATDANGFFTLHTLPVARSATVRVEHDDFNPIEQTITLNYRQPVNQQTFALSS